ncbi:trinucleotide repeat-containing gene 18 protein-like isoform X2 [Oscarella lobularis]
MHHPATLTRLMNAAESWTADSIRGAANPPLHPAALYGLRGPVPYIGFRAPLHPGSTTNAAEMQTLAPNPAFSPHGYERVGVNESRQASQQSPAPLPVAAAATATTAPARHNVAGGGVVDESLSHSHKEESLKPMTLAQHNLKNKEPTESDKMRNVEEWRLSVEKAAREQGGLHQIDEILDHAHNRNKSHRTGRRSSDPDAKRKKTDSAKESKNPPTNGGAPRKSKATPAASTIAAAAVAAAAAASSSSSKPKVDKSTKKLDTTDGKESAYTSNPAFRLFPTMHPGAHPYYHHHHIPPPPPPPLPGFGLSLPPPPHPSGIDLTGMYPPPLPQHTHFNPSPFVTSAGEIPKQPLRQGEDKDRVNKRSVEHHSNQLDGTGTLKGGEMTEASGKAALPPGLNHFKLHNAKSPATGKQPGKLKLDSDAGKSSTLKLKKSRKLDKEKNGGSSGGLEHSPLGVVTATVCAVEGPSLGKGKGNEKDTKKSKGTGQPPPLVTSLTILHDELRPLVFTESPPRMRKPAFEVDSSPQQSPSQSQPPPPRRPTSLFVSEDIRTLPGAEMLEQQTPEEIQERARQFDQDENLKALASPVTPVMPPPPLPGPSQVGQSSGSIVSGLAAVAGSPSSRMKPPSSAMAKPSPLVPTVDEKEKPKEEKRVKRDVGYRLTEPSSGSLSSISMTTAVASSPIKQKKDPVVSYGSGGGGGGLKKTSDPVASQLTSDFENLHVHRKSPEKLRCSDSLRKKPTPPPPLARDLTPPLPPQPSHPLLPPPLFSGAGWTLPSHHPGFQYSRSFYHLNGYPPMLPPVPGMSEWFEQHQRQSHMYQPRLYNGNDELSSPPKELKPDVTPSSLAAEEKQKIRKDEDREERIEESAEKKISKDSEKSKTFNTSLLMLQEEKRTLERELLKEAPELVQRLKTEPPPRPNFIHQIPRSQYLTSPPAPALPFVQRDETRPVFLLNASQARVASKRVSTEAAGKSKRSDAETIDSDSETAAALSPSGPPSRSPHWDVLCYSDDDDDDDENRKHHYLDAESCGSQQEYEIFLSDPFHKLKRQSVECLRTGFNYHSLMKKCEEDNAEIEPRAAASAVERAIAQGRYRSYKSAHRPAWATVVTSGSEGRGSNGGHQGMSAMEVQMRVFLAEVQRQYKSHVTAMNRLKRKARRRAKKLKGVSNDEQEENAKPLMKKRGRPRKRKPLPVKNQSELAGSSAESHSDVEYVRTAAEPALPQEAVQPQPVIKKQRKIRQTGKIADAKGDVSSDEEAAKAQQPPIKKKGRRRRQRQSIAVQPEAKYKKIDSDEDYSMSDDDSDFMYEDEKKRTWKKKPKPPPPPHPSSPAPTPAPESDPAPSTTKVNNDVTGSSENDVGKRKKSKTNVEEKASLTLSESAGKGNKYLAKMLETMIAPPPPPPPSSPQKEHATASASDSVPAKKKMPRRRKVHDFEESSSTSLPAKPNSNGVDGNSSDMDAVTNRRRSERRYVSNDAGESSSLAATASLIGVEEIAAESDVVKTTTTTTTKIKKVNGKKRASRSLEDEKRSCARREDKEESKQWRLTANLLTVHQRLLVRDIDKEGTYSFASITEAKPPDLYAVVVDGDRRRRPEWLTQEEILQRGILDVKPRQVDLPPGTRVCGHWSANQRSYFKGRVVEDDEPGPPGQCFVEFDDGERGRIPLPLLRRIVDSESEEASAPALPSRFSPVSDWSNDRPDLAPAPGDGKLSPASRDSSSSCFIGFDIPLSVPRPPESQLAHRPQYSDISSPSPQGRESSDSVVYELDVPPQRSTLVTLPTPPLSGDSGHGGPFDGTKDWEWCGKGKQNNKKGRGRRTYFKAINKKKGGIIRVGDCALFKAPSRPSIGVILKFWEAWDGKMLARVQWYYWPQQVKTQGPLSEEERAGVYLSGSHTDDIEVSMIVRLCKVLSREEYFRLSSKPDPEKDAVFYELGVHNPNPK